MCRENLLKIAMVEFSMVFLAATLNGVTAQEEKKAHTSISVEHIEVQEPVVYAVHDDYEEQSHVAIPEEPEVTARTFSQEEEELLLQIAMAEAEGEPTEGKAMVMMVVLNRTNSDDFPDSIGEVIFQDGQFAVMEENGRFYTTVPNEDCYGALMQVMAMDNTHLKEALKYHALMCFMTHYRETVKIEDKGRRTKRQAKALRKDVTKPLPLIRKQYVIEEVDSKVLRLPDQKRTYTKPEHEVSVRGYMRHYKSGKSVWIEPFTKYRGKGKNRKDYEL